jgi:hypothetical protein
VSRSFDFQTENAHISAQQIYNVDRFQIRTSGRIFANVGQEIEIARSHGVPVLHLYGRTKQLSRMTHGSPNVIAKVFFEDIKEMLSQVGAAIRGDLKLVSPFYLP